MALRIAPAVAVLATLLGAGCSGNPTTCRKPPTPMPTLPARAVPQQSNASAGAPSRNRPQEATGSVMGPSNGSPVGTGAPAKVPAISHPGGSGGAPGDCGPEG